MADEENEDEEDKGNITLGGDDDDIDNYYTPIKWDQY